MYTTCGAAGTAAACGGGLGLAGTGMNVIWLLLGAFALLGAGLALMRIAPRRQA